MARVNAVSGEIYNDIKAQILSGELSKDDWLVETAIAKQRGINKIHVSYALQQLAEEGFIEYKKRRGYFVKEIDDNDFLEFVKLREIMETQLIKEFLKRATEEQLLDSIRTIKRKLAFLKSNLLNDADEETDKFFSEMQTISKYQQIPKLLSQYQSYIMSVVKTDFRNREDISKTIETNMVLLECLEKRDINLAKKWAKIRYENLIESCYRNLIIKKDKID
jgi:DNA-binding GntR family transcriptional regulator